MSTIRMTHELRRELILAAARRCFATSGFAGTTTKSVAAAASISEGLLFKHFASKSVLYAEILAEQCKADAAFMRARELPPSAKGLIQIVVGMVRHFVHLPKDSDAEDTQQFRLILMSQLDDGEFARTLYAKIQELIGDWFSACLAQAIRDGDAVDLKIDATNLFWFAQHTLSMAALSRLLSEPCLTYQDEPNLDLQIAEFILRGIGINDHVITSSLAKAMSQTAATPEPLESV